MSDPYERHGAYCPWLHDPDPPQRIMTDEECKAAAEKVAAMMRRRRPRSEEEVKAAILKHHPTLTPEKLEEALRGV